MDPTHTWGKGQGAWWSKGLVYEFVDLGRFLWGKNAFPRNRMEWVVGSAIGSINVGPLPDVHRDSPRGTPKKP